jgi:hypothetical protein
MHNYRPCRNSRFAVSRVVLRASKTPQNQGRQQDTGFSGSGESQRTAHSNPENNDERRDYKVYKVICKCFLC